MILEIKLNSELIKVNIKKKRGQKYTYIRIKEKNAIELSVNYYFTKLDALQLIEEKKEWILKSLKKIENSNNINEDEFYFLGKVYKKENIDVDTYYKEEIQKIIPPLIEKHSKLMQLFPTSIKYRKNKRTWGSCNYKNGLNFNTRLCMFPMEIIEYVVIHELAHIEFKNHSRDFWLLVKKYCPNYRELEKRLKEYL